MSVDTRPTCELCGEPMPPGEEMFKFHGFSGSCPKPPLPRPIVPTVEELAEGVARRIMDLELETFGDHLLMVNLRPVIVEALKTVRDRS